MRVKIMFSTAILLCIMILSGCTGRQCLDNDKYSDKVKMQQAISQDVMNNGTENKIDNTPNKIDVYSQFIQRKDRSLILTSRGYMRRFAIEGGTASDILGIEPEVEKKPEDHKSQEQIHKDTVNKNKEEYPVPKGLSNIPEYDSYIDQRIEHYSKQLGVDADIIRGMVMKESTFNPKAKNGRGYGLLQLEPACCEEMGVYYPCTDIDENLRAGIGYFKKQLDQFGDVRLALAAYNYGPPRVQRLMKKYGSNYESIESKLPSLTREHVKKVLGYSRVFRQQNNN